MDEGEGGDQMEQFHRNQAISDVANDGFLGEEDDYEDLYNDVNFGEGFLLFLRKSEDLRLQNRDTKNNNNNTNPEKKVYSSVVARNLGGAVTGDGNVSRLWL